MLSPSVFSPAQKSFVSVLVAQRAIDGIMYISLVDRLDDLLRESPMLSLSAAARRLGVSGRTLQREVARTGQSFVARRGEIRCDIACHRLLSTRDKISAIGSDIGFNSPSHFAGWFKQRVGVTPRELRAHAELHRLAR